MIAKLLRAAALVAALLVGPAIAGSIYNPSTGPGSGTVTSVTCGAGLAGGTFTASGTCSEANGLMQGRLTLASGTPVMTAAVPAAATLYYTPYSGNLVAIWNGSQFVEVTFGEVSQALSDATKSPYAASASSVYDVFGWMDGATFRISRGPAWTSGATAGSNTARGSGAGSTALVRVQGILVNAVAITNGPAAGYGTYLATIATDASGATVSWSLGGAAAGGTAAVLDLWNMYNRVTVPVAVQDTTASWSYTTASYRAAHGSTTNRFSYVGGQPEGAVSAVGSTYGSATGGANVYASIALDSVTVPAGSAAFTPAGSLISVFTAGLSPGSHYLQLVERGQTGGLFSGSDANGQYTQLSATVGPM